MDEVDAILMKGMLAHLRANHSLICRQWFEELAPLGVGGGALELRAASPIHRDYLKRQCADAFNDAVRTVSGRLLSVRFLGPDDAATAPPPTPAKRASKDMSARDAAFREAVEREVARENGLNEQVGPDERARQVQKLGTPTSHDAHAVVHADGVNVISSAHSEAYAPAREPETDLGTESALLRGVNLPTFGEETGSANGSANNTTSAESLHDSSEVQDGAQCGSVNQGHTIHDDSAVSKANGASGATGTQGPTHANGQVSQRLVRATTMPEVVITQAARHGPITPRKPSLVQIGDPSRGGYESLTINPDNSFEHFVPGPANRLAHAAAQAVAVNPGHAYNPFFVHGGIGLGKSHLLQATCLRIAEKHPHLKMYYISCEGFFTQFIESVQNGQMSEFRHRYRDVDLLVIDDIHYLSSRDRTQDEFFNTFNCLYQDKRQIILSSDAPPEEIPSLHERLVSRFKWGLVASMEPPCFETRLAILQAKAKLRGLVLPDDAAAYLAHRIDRNVRELEGAVIQLQIRTEVERRPISLEMAKESMGEPARTKPLEPSIDAIIAVVTDFYRIRLSDLKSKQRQRSITLPRQVCMFLARKLTRHSLEEIGGHFGGRDHTTVLHAVRLIQARQSTDSDFGAVVRSLEERSRGMPA